MDGIKQQINAARKEGYQDDEIMQYLSGVPTVMVLRYSWYSDTVDSLTEVILCAG